MEKKVNVNAVQCGHLMNFSHFSLHHVHHELGCFYLLMYQVCARHNCRKTIQILYFYQFYGKGNGSKTPWRLYSMILLIHDHRALCNVVELG